MELVKAIIAILFYQAEPIAVKRLSALLKRTEGEVRDAITLLPERLKDTGIMLLQNGDEVTLGTAPEASSLIESITKEELSKDLSKSSLETLSIVLYKGPITRSEIDYIRGVNSTFILRNLLIRGLVEKVDNPNDQRSFLYKPTFQLLEYMGVPDVKELPDYHDAIAQLGAFVAAKQEEEKTADTTVTVTEALAEDECADNEIVDVARTMEMTDQELVGEADILEEDEAGGGYDDAQLQAHTEANRTEETL